MNLTVWIPEILNELIRILGIFIIVMIFEYFWGPKQKIDFKNHLINILGAVILIIFGSGLMFYIQSFLPYYIIKESFIRNEYLYAFCFIFLYDFFYYFYHRLQHKWKPLWKIHQFHHTDPNMNVLTSHRSHFLERIIQVTIIGFPVYLILGHNVDAFRIIFILFLFFLVYTHINIQIPHYGLTKIFVGPCVHRIHHSINKSEHNSNFAQIFPLFDILFGTFKMPDKKKIITGMVNCKEYKTQIKTMIWPILGINTDE